MTEVDLLVVVALPEELAEVLNLKDGGKKAWEKRQSPEKYDYYTTKLTFGEGEDFSVCAIAQSDMGGLNTSAVVSNVLAFIKPKIACMVGICAAWRQKSIELGDVIAASHAFIYDVGKKKDDILFSEMKDVAVHPYLKQWLEGFTKDEFWIESVKSKKPLSLRYQQEYLLFKLKDSTNDDWVDSQETKDNCPNYKAAINQLEKRKLVKIGNSIALTEKGKKFLSNLRLKERQTAPIPDKKRPKAHYGSFASGNNVVEDTRIFDWLAEKDRKVLALEMEAAAFLKACYIKEPALPAFIVKGACDYADGEKNDDFHQYAAETSAHFMFHFVRESLPKLKKNNEAKKLASEKEKIANESEKWFIPQETQYFTGRENVLKELHKDLQSEHKAALTQAISGLGGIGKTQTAYRYAREFKNEYDYGFVINASSASDIISGYFAIASKLKLYGEKEEEIIRAVKRWFETKNRWLLIADNADKPKILKDFLPEKHQGHILVTSRNNALEGSGVSKIIKLEVLTPEEARQFFIDRTSRKELSTDEENAIAELASKKALGYLPLALEQAAAYIKTREISFSSYLKSFQQVKIALFNRDSELTEKESVATTWEINFKEIESNQAAKDVLYSIAFLAPDDIPFHLLAVGGKVLSPSVAKALEGVEKDETLISELLYPFTQYSLIQIDHQNSSFSIHRLVQEVIKDKLSDDEQKEHFRHIVEALFVSFPRTEYVDNPLCNALLPHIKELMIYSKEKEVLFEELGLLFSISGYYCHQKAEYVEAEELLKRALQIREKELGKNHLNIATSLNNLASLYKDQGKHKEAELLFKKALQILEKELGENHPNTAMSLNNLASLYKDQGKHKEAELLFKKALQILEKELGENHPDTATSLNNLADLYEDQGRYKEAEPLFKKALQILEKELGESHPHTATSLNNLAGLYNAQGRYKEAEPLLKRALEILEKELGKDHPNTATSLSNLAGLYMRQGRRKEAELMLKRALEVTEKILGTNHLTTTSIISNMVKFYYEQGKQDEAIFYAEKAIKIFNEEYTSQNPNEAVVKSLIELFTSLKIPPYDK